MHYDSCINSGLLDLKLKCVWCCLKTILSMVKLKISHAVVCTAVVRDTEPPKPGFPTTSCKGLQAYEGRGCHYPPPPPQGKKTLLMVTTHSKSVKTSYKQEHNTEQSSLFSIGTSNMLVKKFILSERKKKHRVTKTSRWSDKVRKQRPGQEKKKRKKTWSRH